ncbi:ABC transporter permease [Burkholderia multivorans]|uniref:ABC transporter permease n=1 Tax=Burkholderia multivorans TaxID=87883 RepID=UPI0037355E36
MPRYLASRLLNAVIVVWAAFTVSFVLLYQLPSDPISIMLMGDAGGGGSAQASVAQRQALAERYGFDLSPPRQYLKLLSHAARGDLGISMQSGRPVSAEIADALPPTLRLAGLSLAFALVLGVTVALLGCRSPSGAIRTVLLSIPPVAMAVPTFWIALMLLQVFAFRLNWLPGISTTGFAALILPALTLSIPTSAVIAQTLSKGLDDTLSAPFVRQLRANGIPSRTIYLRHVLHNAMIPTLTVLGLIVGGTFAGAVVTETIFSRAGAGRLLQSAVDVQDLPVVQGLVMLMAIAYAVVNLAVDLLYPVLDPRIRRATSHATQG